MHDDSCRTETTNENREDEAGAKIWSVYITEADKYDKALVESWKNDMDGMLIFAGLFSGILSAFLIESYQSLTPDSDDRMVALLGQISTQLSGMAAGTTIEIPPPEPFVVATSSVVCNLLWFISLGLSLSSALIATLVQQWARDFTYKADMRSSPVIRARIFAYLYYGLKRFNMHAVVDLIPLLLHGSLVLFFVGLVAFLVPVNPSAMNTSIVLLGVLLFVYATLTVFPLLHHDAPYKTPLSAGLWLIVQYLRTFYPGHNVSRTSSKSLVNAMNNAAVRPSAYRNQRDCRALCWTVKSLSDDDELEPFLEGIPDALYSWGLRGRRTAYDKQIQALVCDPKVQLVKRVESFLRDCESDLLKAEAGARRHITALKALWAIAATFPTTPPLMIEPSAQLDWGLVRQSALREEINHFQISARAALYLHVVVSLSHEINAHLQVLASLAGRLPEKFISQKWQMIVMEESLPVPLHWQMEDLEHEAETFTLHHILNERNSGYKEFSSNYGMARSALQSMHRALIRIQHTVYVDFLSIAAVQASPPYQFEATMSLFASRSLSHDKTADSDAEVAKRYSEAFDLIVNKLTTITKHADEVLGTLLFLWGRARDASIPYAPTRLAEYLEKQPYRTQSALLSERNTLHLCCGLTAHLEPNDSQQVSAGLWTAASTMVGQHQNNTQVAKPWKVDGELSSHLQLVEQIFGSLGPFLSCTPVHSTIPLIQTFALNTMFPEPVNSRNWKFEAHTAILVRPLFA
ncbi:hypothetical protein R3P38DRAFT_2555554, partial [Favolaschia claudopus]